jgi:mRNA interferase HigB
VRVIAKRTLNTFGNSHPDVVDALMDWYRKMMRCEAKHIHELLETFGTADAVGEGKRYTCFNVKGNTYRLIARVQYGNQAVYIKKILTHKEYTRRYNQ